MQIAALIERIGRLLHADAHKEGLLPVQWETLRFLDRANRFSRNPAALAAYLGLTKGTVSQTLKTLEARRLVTKQVDPGDRRVRRLALSAKGRKLLRHDPLAEMVVAIEALPETAQASLARHLQKVLSGRLNAIGRQPFGQCHECVYFSREHADGSPHFCTLLKEPLSAADADKICYEQSVRQ